MIFKASSVAQEEASTASTVSTEVCISELRSWMATVRSTVYHIPRLRHKLTISILTIGDSVIQLSTKARNLRIIFDQHLGMEATWMFCANHATDPCLGLVTSASTSPRRHRAAGPLLRHVATWQWELSPLRPPRRLTGQASVSPEHRC